MNVFQFFIICKRTNNANNATHYVKLGKKGRESSKRNYYIISPSVIIKAIVIRFRTLFLGKETVKNFFYKRSNSGRNESTPQTQNNVRWISSKAELEILFLNSLLEM